MPWKDDRRVDHAAFCAIILFLMLAAASARADKWAFQPILEHRRSTFGETLIDLEFDTTKNSSYPLYTLRIYRNEKLLREHIGIGYSKLFSSKDNNYFLGVSNDGRDPLAYVVFNGDGEIISQVRHNTAGIHCCRQTVTVVREWIDLEHPKVEFNINNGKLRDIEVKGCDGSLVKLNLQTGHTETVDSFTGSLLHR